MVQLRKMNALVDMLADVKYALRRFNKSPGFTATAVVTLALGIGATAAIFTLIQQVMLRSLAVAKPEQLWRIGDASTCCYSTGYTQSNHAAENDWTMFSWEAYQRFRGDSAAFEQLAAFQVGKRPNTLWRRLLARFRLRHRRRPPSPSPAALLDGPSYGVYRFR